MKATLPAALILLTLNGIVAQEPTPARTKVEQRLAELLLPGGKANGPGPGSALPPRRAPLQIERPEVPLTSPPVLPPSPPKPEPRAVRPRTLPEEAPFVRSFSQPDAPEAIVMTTEPLVRLWTWNVNEPLPLPILGTGLRDRASLSDPSLDASVAATLARHNPERTQPVPFQPMNLPDPFEFTQYIRLRLPLDESPEQPLSVHPFGR